MSRVTFLSRLLILLAGAVTALPHAEARAQGTTAAQATAARFAPDSPRKLDEFERVGSCDHGARLDNFAIELANDPQAVGYIIAYGPEGDASGTGNFRLLVSKDYLVNSRGIDPARVMTIYGGRYKDLEETATELWIAPDGAPAPAPMRYENGAAEFTGKFNEYRVWDALPYGEEESPGISVGNVPLANFADILRSQPSATGYIVAYSGEEGAPGAWRRASERAAKALQASYGVEAGRVKIIFGGYREETALQLWSLPKGAPPPVNEVKDDRKLAKAIRLGSFDQSSLKYEGARQVFDNFADILRGDKSLKVCVIIRTEIPGAGVPDEPGAIAMEETGQDVSGEAPPEEEADLDIFGLVDVWKKDLAKEYKIGEDRLVVIVAPTADEFRVGRLETWVVPTGVALPDPNAPDEDEVMAEATEPEAAEPE